jgi:tRNA(Ile)-lysidine synthase TilS/MesJ
MIPVDATAMHALVQQVQQTIQDYQMVDRGHTVLVAVSGGPDSMVLLHTLWHLLSHSL